MPNPSMETKVKELLELKRMKEEIEAEITGMEDGFVLFLKMQHIRKTAGIAFRSSAGAKMFGADGTDGEVFILIHMTVIHGAVFQ